MAPRSGFGSLPPKTALYLLIGSGVLVLFVLLGILPMQKSLQDLDRQMEQTRFRIEEQGALHPIYLKMLAIAKAGGAAAPKLPERQSLGQKDVSELTDSLAQFIVKTGLEVQSVTPDPGSLGKGSKFLAVNIHVRGTLEQIRTFLGELAMMPSYENIESFNLQPGSGPRDVTVKVWLAAE
ncbi:type 4a pilus biogenesis protein PilO [Fundidesulfovibrio terrae]|uniref:type 4a pilus biogenesis protein PilO n=1 Tax=Fundidesulfovibrio terrae TaxID=2922866 RepID=UPI001FAEFF2E|nr:type 4a pilus biogenesis protein PilO [Fundidesulfovibrio terrae]